MCRNVDRFLRDIRAKIIEPSALIHYEHHAFCNTQLLFLLNLSILHNLTSLTLNTNETAYQMTSDQTSKSYSFCFAQTQPWM